MYLHGVSLPGGRLSVREDGAIVSAQNIWEEQGTREDAARPAWLRVLAGAYLSRSAWRRCCTPAPGWCWWETRGRRRRSSPVEAHGQLNP